MWIYISTTASTSFNNLNSIVPYNTVMSSDFAKNLHNLF